MSPLIERIGWSMIAQVADAPVGAPEAADAASPAQVTSVLDFVMKGGWMMIPLGICSLVAVTVVVERLVSLRRKRVIPPEFLPRLRQGLGGKGDDHGAALECCRSDDSPVAHVFAAGIRRLGGPIEIVERHIQETGQREILKLRRYLRVLSVIATVSPLLGLLGTIFGMISAFQTVASSPDALGKTELLAGGIYEAMITTAAGLLVAIPALICYHWLSARVQSLVMEIDEMTVDFVEEMVLGGPAPARAPIDEGAAAADAPAPTRDGVLGGTAGARPATT